jgi:hypothetical protein
MSIRKAYDVSARLESLHRRFERAANASSSIPILPVNAWFSWGLMFKVKVDENL